MDRKIKYVISIVAFFAAIVIGFIAMFIPPQGIIDSSVLWWTSQLLIFCATILGIDFKIDYGNRTISTRKEEQK